MLCMYRLPKVTRLSAWLRKQSDEFRWMNSTHANELVGSTGLSAHMCLKFGEIYGNISMIYGANSSKKSFYFVLLLLLAAAAASNNISWRKWW